MPHPTACFLAVTLLAACARAAEPNTDEVLKLSVFEVSSDLDRGYAASTALSGTRTNEKLANLPNAISVMTPDLLSDLGALNILDAVDFAVGAENIYNDSGTRGAAVGTRSGNQIGFRGLPSVRQLRDGFPSYMPQDVFNTERIEFSRGPGGLSYGDVDAGGTVNVSSKRATLGRTFATVASRWERWALRNATGHRASADVQATLWPDRVALRVNGVYQDGEAARQRGGSHLQGGALALRWKASRRTTVDVTFERVNQRDGRSHGLLTDDTTVYVRGTGTVAPDADPGRPGVQVNGIGTARMAAPGNVQLFTLIGDRIYNLESTATETFRYSRVDTGATAAALDVNPQRRPRIHAPDSLVPFFEDWGGPMNFADLHWRTLLAEVRHEFTPRFRGLLAASHQVDQSVRPRTTLDNLQESFGGRGIFIDVNPSLLDVSDPRAPRLVPNPYYEKYYIQHGLSTDNDGHTINSIRGVAVYDATLPWGIAQRVVASGGFRSENYHRDIFNEMLTPAEITRRGLTGAAASQLNNLVYRHHYLIDGNSDAALSNRPIPGLETGFFRRNLFGTNARYDQNLFNAAVNVLGRYFRDRLHTSIGVSRDRWHQKIAGVAVDNATGITSFVDANGRPLPEGADIPTFEANEQWVTNQTYGAVFHVVPWLSLTGAWLQSFQFSDNVGNDLNGDPFPGLGGKGIDGGVRLNLLNERFTLSYVRFRTVGTFVPVAVSSAVRDELSPYNARPFVSLQDYRDRKSLGHEVEAFFSPTPSFTARLTYSSALVSFTSFYPLLRARYAEAIATARSRNRDPLALFPSTEQFFADAVDLNGVTSRAASLTARYSFMRGPLKGLSLGGSARYQQGKPMPGVTIAGVEVIPPKSTDDQYLFNPFASYRRKLGRVTWTGQVNVQNVFNRMSLQGRNYRNNFLTNPRQIVVSNTFAF